MNNNIKIIGFWGLTFNSGNMGCNALSYSFLHIIKSLDIGNLRVYVFHQSNEEFDTTGLSSDNIEVVSVKYNPKSIKSIKNLISKIKECSVNFDFTAGDSFSDIYGLKGFIKSTMIKLLVIRYSSKFVLCPQTYGPYTDVIAKKMARRAIKKSTYVCSRDEISATAVANLCGIKIDTYTDVAFALPYESNNQLKSKKLKVGINISGLLWRGGYTGKNQFELTLDYKEYILQLIEQLKLDANIDIYIVPHVIGAKESIESDYYISEELSEKHNLSLSPKFKNPIEAKSFISELDIFIGARMHATIAAFSSGVVTIPVSYSRKFEGLYNSLGYNYTINARELSTDQAVEKTLKFINDKDKLHGVQQKSMIDVNGILANFRSKLDEILKD